MKLKNAFLFLIIPSVVFTKTYFYPEIKTRIVFNPDGSANVVQQRTYYFDGTFSWAYVDLKKRGAQDIVFNRLVELTPDHEILLNPEIDDSERSLYIKWDYSAQDEIKTFLLDYTIVGVVSRYLDVAEFYWKVIEDEHEKVVDNEIELVLPAPSPNLFKVYIHSRAKPGTLIFSKENDKAIIKQKNIPKNSFVEVRMLTSPTIFGKATIRPERYYQKILNQEKRNFIVSSIKRFVLIPIGLLLIIVCPAIVFFSYYFKYGREAKLSYIGQYEHDVPRAVLPIMVPAILHQKPAKSTINTITFNGIVATLFDLCTKGIVSVQEIKDNNKKHYQFLLEKPEKVENLEPINKKIVDFLFSEVGESSVLLTEKALKEYVTKHANKFQSFLQSIHQQTQQWWEDTLGAPLIDAESNRAYNKFLLLVLGIIVVGSILLSLGLSAILGGPAFIVAMLVAVIFYIVFVLVGRSILRWSDVARQEQQRWLNFRRFLTDFSAIKRAPIALLPIWEHYFVYAVVLIVAHKFLIDVINLATEQNMPIVLPFWYSSTTFGGQSMASFAKSISHFESFVKNFDSMLDSFSSSAATGGGFSGGGGGGGGGGSSGAG
ncbi:MAG: DUF2207 domain-containing protein [candidate division WOR-3 bacterium]|nr:DUF2207 domain-containing protein [candidate division WOR-3 bacterium]